MAKTAYVGATIVDGKGGTPIENGMVLIDGDRFKFVGQRTDAPPVDYEVVDVTGKYLMPGIVNANVHLIDGIMLMGVGGIEHLARYEGRFHEVIEEAAQIALKGGMTTVFDTWNALEPIKKARGRINAGIVKGARIYLAGNIVGMGGPFSGDFCLQCRPFMTKTFADRIDKLFEAGVGRRLSALTLEDVRSLVREYIAKDIDFLKFAVSDHTNPPIGPYFTFSDRINRMIVDETKGAGLPVVTHTTSVESLRAAIDLKVDAMMHCTITAQVPIPEDLIAQMTRDTVWGEIQPTTLKFQTAMEKRKDRWARYAGGVHRENTVRLIKATAPILMGTDAGCTDPDAIEDLVPEEREERPWTLGEDHFHWFTAMSEMGMAPMAQIMAATHHVAVAYGKADELGALEAGLYADMLVLNGDPVANTANISKIISVIKSGQVVDRDALPTKKVVTAPRFWCD